MPTSSKRMFLVAIAGITGYWSTTSGGELELRTATKVWDGGALFPELLPGLSEGTDLTVSRPFQPQRDNSIMRGLLPKVGNWRTTIFIQPTDADLVPVAPATGWQGMLTKLTPPPFDASSSEAAMLALIFAIGRLI